MIDITSMDGYRKGSFAFGEHIVPIPAHVSVTRDSIVIQGVTLPKPLAYPLRRHMVPSNMTAVPYFRISKGAPREIARRIQKKNATMPVEGDVTSVYLSGYDDYDMPYVSSLRKVKVFLFNLEHERSLLTHFFFIRKKYPESLCYCECEPEEVPVLAFAGFDLFPDSPEHIQALKTYMDSPTPHYLEMAACASLRAKTLLNLLYMDYYDDIEQYVATPSKKQLCISRDAFWRPSITRWTKKIIYTYSPPSNIILLLPCSARKPYSTSQSHRRLISLIKSVLTKRVYPSLTQLIVTSPYGVVPRELESQIDYDIVVTGTWTEEEIQRSRDMIRSLIAKVENPFVIAHLPENELAVAKGLGVETVITSVGHPLSEDSMKALKDTLFDVREKLVQPQRSYLALRKLSEYLYGEDILPEEIFVKGRSQQQAFAGKTPVASIGATIRPLIHDVAPKKSWVTVDFDVIGDIFCAGVLNADPEIRIGDDVIVMRKEKAVAVGTALLPGHLMCALPHGKAVKVRKKIK